MVIHIWNLKFFGLVSINETWAKFRCLSFSIDMLIRAVTPTLNTIQLFVRNLHKTEIFISHLS
jgi:hypothetical protein